MENNQIKFTKILEEIKFTALSQGGFINEDEVYALFEDMNLSKTQYEMVFEYLKEHKIGINEPLSDNAVFNDEEKNVVEEYTKELDLIDSISDGEKKAYIMAAMNNDKNAIDKLIKYYLPKVLEIAKLYVSQGLLLEDLIGEGNLAVIEGVNMLGAIEEPSEADGMIYKMIMDAMELSISENYNERLNDEKISDKVNKVFLKAQSLSSDLGRKVTVDELAENTSLSRKAILEAVKLTGNQIEEIEYNPDV